MRVSSGADVIPLVPLVVIYSINNVILGEEKLKEKRETRLFNVLFQFYRMSPKGQVIQCSFDIGFAFFRISERAQDVVYGPSLCA